MENATKAHKSYYTVSSCTHCGVKTSPRRKNGEQLLNKKSTHCEACSKRFVPKDETVVEKPSKNGN